MKYFYFFVILFYLNGCSFDNKSGIWNSGQISNEKKQDVVFKDFKKITSSQEVFRETIKISPEFKFSIDRPIKNIAWKDSFYSKSNNLKNFKYNNTYESILKTKKLSKYDMNEYIVFEKDNLITSDQAGNVIIFSINENKINLKFNFYKKKYKKIKKFLNLIVDNNIIYITDNIGFIYALNYKDNKILWAKNHKVPFRSNLKMNSNKLFTSNQNNDFLIFDKFTGNLIKKIPSEETVINNAFINNISLSDNEIFFLNSYGSLYSINNENYKLNWFVNLNKSLDLSLSSLFNGSELVYYKDKIFLSTSENFYIIDSNNGAILSKKKFSSLIRPLVFNKYIFLISKNNYLISLDINGNIIYSYDLDNKLANFIKTKKKTLNIKNMMIVNNGIFIFLNNSYLIKLKIDGEIEEVIKLASNIGSHPIIINDKLLYLNKRNKLFVLN